MLQTNLSNISAVLHPLGMILNAGWIEHTAGNFLFYSEGVSAAVARTIEYIDKERSEIIQKLGLKAATFSERSFIDMALSVFNSIYEVVQEPSSSQRYGSRSVVSELHFGRFIASPFTSVYACTTRQ